MRRHLDAEILVLHSRAGEAVPVSSALADTQAFGERPEAKQSTDVFERWKVEKAW